jgi:chromosomal replication initiation ATPase DnaA
MKTDELILLSRSLYGGNYIEETQTVTEEIERMIYIVSETVGVRKSDIQGNCRKKDLAAARHLVCYYLYNVFGLSLTRIGKILNKHHSTVIHALRQHDGRYAFDKEYRDYFDKSSIYIL